MSTDHAWLAAALWAAFSASPALAASYTVEPLIVQGDRPADINGITEGGVIYGAFATKAGALRAFTQQGGHVAVFDVGRTNFLEVRGNDAARIAGLEIVGSSFNLYRQGTGGVQLLQSLTSLAVGLDDAGNLFGTSDGAAGNPTYTHGVIWEAGSKHSVSFKVPGSDGTFFTCVNGPGTVAGRFTNFGGRLQTGFTLAAGKITAVAVPGYTQSSVVGINDGGTLAVVAQTASGVTGAFLDIAGNFTQISPPGAIAVNLQGVNNQNFAYGMYETADAVFHPFVFSGGTYTTFSPPSGTLFNFYALGGMDAKGNLVGVYQQNTFPVFFVAKCSGAGC